MDDVVLCLECQKPVPKSRRARPRKFCCDQCRLRYNRKLRDPIKQVKAAIKWARENRERVAEARRRYKKRHPVKMRSAALRWYYKHRDEIWLRKRFRQFGIVTPNDLEILIALRDWRRAKRK